LWEASEWDVSRNVPLVSLLPLLEIEGVELFNFQRGGGREQLRSLKLENRIGDLSGDHRTRIRVQSFAARCHDQLFYRTRTQGLQERRGSNIVDTGGLEDDSLRFHRARIGPVRSEMSITFALASTTGALRTPPL
jgi:hypothetical protein